jgi:hypothetical protein
MSKLYPKWKGALMSGAADASLTVDSDTDGLYAAFFDLDSYEYDDSHEFYDDVSASVVGDPARITNVVLGDSGMSVFGDDTNFPVIPAGGPSIEGILLFRKNSGPSSTWRLVGYIDSGAGFPLIGNGSDVTIEWSPVGGIFGL